MSTRPRFQIDRDPEFRHAVARLRVALARYRFKRAFDEAARSMSAEQRKTDPRRPAHRPADPLTN
jgi:hypothetical protein